VYKNLGNQYNAKVSRWNDKMEPQVTRCWRFGYLVISWQS